MSKRFFVLCLIAVLGSNIFFVNLLHYTSLNDLTPNDVTLGKILNQSVHWLIIGYLIVKRFWLLKSHLINMLVSIFAIDIFMELLSYLVTSHSSELVMDSLLISVQRLLWVYIFILLGSNFLSTNRANNIFSLILEVILFAFCLFLFQRSEALYAFLLIMMLIVSFVMTTFACNIKEKLFHAYSLGAILILLADIAFIYSRFNQDIYWQQLFIIPRTFLALGELLLAYQLLKKYRFTDLQMS